MRVYYFGELVADVNKNKNGADTDNTSANTSTTTQMYCNTKTAQRGSFRRSDYADDVYKPSGFVVRNFANA